MGSSVRNPGSLNPIDLWWDSGCAIAVIHLDPPLLFRGPDSVYAVGAFACPCHSTLSVPLEPVQGPLTLLICPLGQNRW